MENILRIRYKTYHAEGSLTVNMDKFFPKYCTVGDFKKIILQEVIWSDNPDELLEKMERHFVECLKNDEELPKTYKERFKKYLAEIAKRKW